jgi:phage terminase Nu1 subunit (DNA packaging protein)
MNSDAVAAVTARFVGARLAASISSLLNDVPLIYRRRLGESKIPQLILFLRVSLQ